MVGYGGSDENEGIPTAGGTAEPDTEAGNGAEARTEEERYEMGSGQHRAYCHRQQAGQPVPHAAAIAWIGHGGRVCHPPQLRWGGLVVVAQPEGDTGNKR